MIARGFCSGGSHLKRPVRDGHARPLGDVFVLEQRGAAGRGFWLRRVVRVVGEPAYIRQRNRGFPLLHYAHYHGNKWVEYGPEKMEWMFPHRSFLDYDIPVAPASD